MFYCKVCQEKNKWPASLAKSIGNCEVCGTRDLCNDVKSSNLPIMKGNDMEHTKGKIEVWSHIGRGWAVQVMCCKDGKDALSGRDFEEAQANADELVRRWNAFEDGGIVEELRTALEKIADQAQRAALVQDRSVGIIKQTCGVIFKEAEAALAKS